MLEMEVAGAEMEAAILILRTQSVQYLKLENMRARERQKRHKKEFFIIQYGNNLTTRFQESVYILTNLGQLPFTLFTKIAKPRLSTGKCEYGHYIPVFDTPP